MDDIVTLFTKFAGRWLRNAPGDLSRRARSARRRYASMLPVARISLPIGCMLVLVGGVGWLDGWLPGYLSLACAVIGLLVAIASVFGWAYLWLLDRLVAEYDRWEARKKEDERRANEYRLVVARSANACLAELKGNRLRNQHEFKQAVEKAVANAKIEVSMVALLADDNTVLDTDYRTGTNNMVRHSPAEIIQKARETGAAKIIVAHNHPGGAGDPSDPDVDWAASLYEKARRVGIELKDNFVVCTDGHTRRLKSVLRTRRFQDRVRPY